jgi:hypothetical protein
MPIVLVPHHASCRDALREHIEQNRAKNKGPRTSPNNTA